MVDPRAEKRGAGSLHPRHLPGCSASAAACARHSAGRAAGSGQRLRGRAWAGILAPCRWRAWASRRCRRADTSCSRTRHRGPQMMHATSVQRCAGWGTSREQGWRGRRRGDEAPRSRAGQRAGRRRGQPAAARRRPCTHCSAHGLCPLPPRLHLALQLFHFRLPGRDLGLHALELCCAAHRASGMGRQWARSACTGRPNRHFPTSNRQFLRPTLRPRVSPGGALALQTLCTPDPNLPWRPRVITPQRAAWLPSLANPPPRPPALEGRLTCCNQEQPDHAQGGQPSSVITPGLQPVVMPGTSPAAAAVAAAAAAALPCAVPSALPLPCPLQTQRHAAHTQAALPPGHPRPPAPPLHLYLHPH